MKRLVVFTASFPYGNAEPFLEDEIIYLCEQFTDVVLIPLTGYGTKSRTTPNNCEVIEPVMKSRLWKAIMGFYNLRTFIPFVFDFFKNKVFLNKRKVSIWLANYFNTNLLLNDKKVREILRKLTKEDVCYFYWGVGANCLSIFLKGKVKTVSRFHGEWDLWEESSGNYATLRERIISSLDAQIFISEKGKEYLSSKYNCSKAHVCRLGTQDFGIGHKSKDGVLRVVSCSTVYPLKRVPLIFDVLNHYSRCSIEWTHLGGGPDYEDLLSYTKHHASSNIKVNLLGQVSHEDVLEYYKNNDVDIFVNLSTSEGLPVSIMEALSFDIPILATNVGSTSEAVVNSSGVLVDVDASIDNICQAIDLLITTSFTPREIWESKFNANTNYSEFSELLFTI